MSSQPSVCSFVLRALAALRTPPVQQLQLHNRAFGRGWNLYCQIESQEHLWPGPLLRVCPLLFLQAMASREELHAQCAQSFQDKDKLRKQVRELGEKADELQLQLFQSEGRLLAAEGRLKQQQLDMLTLVGLCLLYPWWSAQGGSWGGRGARQDRKHKHAAWHPHS